LTPGTKQGVPDAVAGLHRPAKNASTQIMLVGCGVRLASAETLRDTFDRRPHPNQRLGQSRGQ